MDKPSSNLFEGYKSVGHVTGPLPFIVRHGKSPNDTRIIAIVGRTFHTYTTNLSLVEVSVPHEQDIITICSDDRLIYTASGRTILCWSRGSKKLVQRLDNGHQANVTKILAFGSGKLVSVDEDNVLFNWNSRDKEILNIISIDDCNFKISALCHPSNYKDKILLGSQQGQLQLWNISHEQCLYKFQDFDSPVTCLAQSPVQDVVAVGLQDGHVHIINIKYDELVIKIYQEYGAITSMSFRLDGSPYLVTASEVGHLMVWNLERKRLSSQIRNAHSNPISKCQFLRNESLLVTSAHDNSIKIWNLDMSDGGGNLLTQRCGHSEPPSCIKFYGPKGFNLLSAGNDSTMKMFHLYSERLNRNLGYARINSKAKHRSGKPVSKLAPITCFASETAKEKQWDNIAACHRDSDSVSTWNYDKCKMGEFLISQPTFSKHNVIASSVCITGCGNFCVIGFSNGFIFKYNMQSGIFRQTYECPDSIEHMAHEGAVTGLTVDGLDIVLISSGLDSKLRVWNFKTGALLVTTDFVAPIIKIDLHRENNLIAIAMSNHTVEIMDLETRTLTRRFEGQSKITDMTFSPDSRWLIVSYEDKSIRTWDLNLGKMIDAFMLSEVCVSLSISSTGEFLATAHENSLGINIWSNYTIYCPKTLKSIDYSTPVPQLDMPFVRCDEQLLQDDQESEDQTLPVVDPESEQDFVSPTQIDAELITLSGLPSSRWKNLLNIDELRTKQLIEEDDKKDRQIKVPFFIPVKDGLNPKLDGNVIEDKNEKEREERLRSKIKDIRLVSPLIEHLIQCDSKKEYDTFLNQLKELGPSATDVEIRSLGIDTCGNEAATLAFLNAMEHGIKLRLDYELISSWLALFLKAHSDVIQRNSKVRKRSFELLEPVRTNWDRLDKQFNQIFCMLNFVRSSIL